MTHLDAWRAAAARLGVQRAAAAGGLARSGPMAAAAQEPHGRLGLATTRTSRGDAARQEPSRGSRAARGSNDPSAIGRVRATSTSPNQSSK